MNKILFIFSFLALLASCGGNSGFEYDIYYSRDGEEDSTAAANVNVLPDSRK